jgi:hypothetical protein
MGFVFDALDTDKDGQIIETNLFAMMNGSEIFFSTGLRLWWSPPGGTKLERRSPSLGKGLVETSRTCLCRYSVKFISQRHVAFSDLEIRVAYVRFTNIN